ncbi:MAG: thioredoxin family protein [Planctomycetota bacterium]|nr:thioredoxin family protein [Planctomycetota bacterium]
MAETPSTMLPLGTKAPLFELPDPDGEKFSINDFDADILVVMFICNHCPFVIHYKKLFAELSEQYRDKSVDIVAINSNDIENYPADSPQKMKEMKEKEGWDFPYLLDEDQSVAKTYMAACTPDVYVFDRNRELFYRGQIDSTRPGSTDNPDGEDLRNAIDSCLERESAPKIQIPSTGCNIKWKKGNEPEYF